MKIPIIVCLPRTDFLWWKNIFPDDFPLKNLVPLSHKEQKTLRPWKQESSKTLLKVNLKKEKCIGAHPVITNTLS